MRILRGSWCLFTLYITSQASKLANEAPTSKPHTSTSSSAGHSKQNSASSKAHASAVLDTESTPYLMMQQQQAQRDLKNGVAAGTGGTGKRLSGVMEGFFTVRLPFALLLLFLFIHDVQL